MDARGIAAAIAAACVACSAPAPAGRSEAPAQFAGLPAPSPVDTPRFAGVAACVRCHTAGDTAMRDGRGADISPVTQANAAMMALSARDPYYLAALQRELEHVADIAAATALCVRCHAPVGFQEALANGGTVDLAAIEQGSSAAARLAREGVGCAGCHALDPAGLDAETAFDGSATFRRDRVSFGAVPEPADDAMRSMIHQAVVPSPHVTSSALCASCHTVIVPALNGTEIVEQATYLEWRASQYASRGQTCQDCHLHAVTAATPFATRPPTSPARDGYREHAIRGGSAYLLSRLAAHRDLVGATATAAQLGDAAADTAAFLTTAAKLDAAAVPSGVAVTVTNLTGHKLPTGYPTRRMWLHAVARDPSGAVVLESGKFDRGNIVGRGGRRLDARGAVLPHVDRITSADDVAVWEEVPVGSDGRRTHLLLGTAQIIKDDRILPAGFSPVGDDVRRTQPIGVGGDADFVPGRDTVTIALPATAKTVELELLYQAIPPETLESYNPRHPEAARFLAVADVAPEPQVLAKAGWTR